jgi:hypothetical protein
MWFALSSVPKVTIKRRQLSNTDKKINCQAKFFYVQ